MDHQGFSMGGVLHFGTSMQSATIGSNTHPLFVSGTSKKELLLIACFGGPGFESRLQLAALGGSGRQQLMRSGVPLARVEETRMQLWVSGFGQSGAAVGV